MRVVGLLLAGLFVAGFAALTLLQIARHGMDGIALLSLLILIMFVIGLLSALRRPPGA